MTRETETSEDREIIELFEKLKPEYKKIKDIYSGQDEIGPKWRSFSDMVERDEAEKLAGESAGKDKARYEARQWFYENTIERESESPIYLGYRSLAYNQKQDV